MIELVVNADDLGRSPQTNAGIFKAFRSGIVTSASLMTNMPAFEEAVSGAEELQLPLGLHLNLTEGRPLCPAGAIPTLVNEEGQFFGKTDFFLRLKQGKISLEDVRREVTVQTERALQFGLRLDHLDGHHHVHAVPPVYAVSAETARKAGIPFMRVVSPPRFLFPIRAFAQQAATCVSLKRVKGLAGADHFWGFELWLVENKEAALLRLIDLLRPGLNELMCHPAAGGSNEGRTAELEALCSERVKEKLMRRRVRLCSFSAAEAVRGERKRCSAN